MHPRARAGVAAAAAAAAAAWWLWRSRNQKDAVAAAPEPVVAEEVPEGGITTAAAVAEEVPEGGIPTAAATASAWVNFATTILQTSTDDASLARAVDLLERSVDQRTRIIVEAGPSREARRQLGLSYANLGLARIRADRNSEGRQYLEAAHKIAVDTRDAFLERMIRANANNNPEIGLRFFLIGMSTRVAAQAEKKLAADDSQTTWKR
ncbi:hypothetical protein JL721_8779 [Aureococcus anophagefferens]|nr:hypothetical protein JL721_8779 [Aureococcus anophagefferens]